MTDIDTSSRKDQRQFGIVMAVVISLVGIIRWILHGSNTDELPFWYFGIACIF